MLPQPVTHILDWFHISMKVQPIAQLAATGPKHLSSFESHVERIRWRLWNGQAGRALSLIAKVRRVVSRETVPSIWAHRADRLVEILQTYIRRNKGSVVNYAVRYREGKRIATSPAEASSQQAGRQAICEKATNAMVTHRSSLLAESSGIRAERRPA